MFLFALGMIIGLFISMISLSYILIVDIKLDMAVWTNIIIAAGTAIAVLVHHDSIKMQRKDRIWEINKDVLLDLLDLVSQVISETELLIDAEYTHDHHYKSDPRLWSRLNAQINLALNVYGSLMGEDLIKHIKESKSIDQKIHNEVYHEDLDHIDAHIWSLKNRQDLQLQLKLFISQMAGVHS